MKRTKRVLSWLLCLAMVLSLVPTTVLNIRAETDGEPGLPADALAAVWSEPVTVNNTLDEAAWNFLSKAITGEGPSGQLRARWDKDGLTLGITAPEATSISASVNGKEAEPVNGTVAELHYTWGETGISLTDYNLPIPVQVALKSDSGTTVQDVVVYNSTSQVAEAMDLSKFGKSNATVANGIATMSATGARAYLYKNNNAVVDHSKDIVVSQTLNITTLPVVNEADVKLSNTNNVVCKGALTLWVVDEQSSASGVADGNGVFTAIYYTGENANLKLKVLGFEGTTSAALATVDLGKKLGQSFDLAIRWNADDSVYIYVDGKQVGGVADGTLHYTKGLSVKVTYFNFYNRNAADSLEAQISNMAVSHAGTGEESIVEDVKVKLQTDLAVLNKSLESNVDLPTEYTGDAKLGDVPLTWESSNTAVLKNDGTIIPATTDATATLTAKLGTKTVHSWAVTVKGIADTNPLKAVWSETITDDDAFTEAAWALPMTKTVAATVAGAPTGIMKALWNKDGLTLGVTSDAESMKATINGVEKTAKAGKAELSFTWEELGGAPKDYNQNINVDLTLTNTAGDSVLKTSVINSVTKIVDPFDLSQVSTGGNFRRNGEVSIANGVATIDADATAFLFKIKNTANMTHAKDIVVSQTINVNSLPVVDEKKVMLTSTGNISCMDVLALWLTDKESSAKGATGGTGVFTAIYSTGAEETLKLRVLGFEGTTPAALATVDLGKELGKEFDLAIRWNADDSVYIYVDGEQVGYAANGTLNYTNGLGANATRYQFVPNTGKAMKATVSDIAISHVGTGEESVVDTIKANWKPLSSYAGIAQEGNVTVPAAYADPMLGDIPVVWKSSDETVITADGVITQKVEEASATLSAWLGENEVYKQEITVAAINLNGDAATEVTAGMAEDIRIDGVMDEAAWFNRFFISQDSETAPKGTLSALYDRNGLFLGLNFANANAATLTINGKTVNVNLANATTTVGGIAVKDGVAELFLPWTALDVTLKDYNQQIPGLTLSLTDGTNTTHLSGTGNPEIPLIITAEQVSAVQVCLNKAYGAGITCDNGVVKWNATASTEAVLTAFARDRLLDHSKDMMLVQTLCINDLPVHTGMLTSGKKHDISEGYRFWISPKANATDGIGFFACVYRANEEGDLWLRVQNNAEHPNHEGALNISLGKKLGETFTLSTLWTADDKVVVFVDGVKIGEGANVTLTSTESAGDRYLFFSYYTRLKNTAQITLSNVKLVKTVASSVTEQMDVMPNISTGAISDDILLPSVFSSPWLGDFPIAWESSNSAVLDHTGKVTNPAAATEVTLTATSTVHNTVVVDGQKVTVLPAPTATAKPEAQSPDRITVAFVWDRIIVDGEPNEIGWVLGSHTLNADSIATGKFGAQWDKTHLYLMAKVNDAPTAEFIIGGKTVKVDLSTLALSGDVASAKIKKTNNYLEMAIALSDLGIAPAYSKEIAVTAKIGAGSYTGTLCLSDISWFKADNEARPIAPYGSGAANIGGGSYQKNDFESAVQIPDGWRMYSLFDPSGTNNKTLTRVYVAFGRSVDWLPKGATDKNIHMEFDFLANNMPVYDAAADVGFHSASTYANYGFTWWHSKIEQGKNSEAVVLGILNTADGLVFCALRGTDAPFTVKLNRQVGDVVRIGTTWKVNGDLVVSVDGVEIATIEGAATLGAGMDQLATVYGLLRNATAAASEADNLDVCVTNLSAGQAFSPVDEVTFLTIRGENTSENMITSDLELPTVWLDDQLDEETTITWTSSDEATINPNTLDL